MALPLDGNLNQINASTRRYVRKSPTLVDTIFHNSPEFGYARGNLREDFTGGSRIQETFAWREMKGGAYAPGGAFNITEQQIEDAAQFNIKFIYVSVPLTKEHIQVINTGDEHRIFSIVESRMSRAYETMGQFCSVAMWLNGINAGYTNNVNGITEAVNDGSNAGWDGNVYANYGGLARTSGTSGGTLVSPQPRNAAGPITLDILSASFDDVCFGGPGYEPNMGVTTHAGYRYIKNNFQSQQRFNDTQDPKINFNGLKYETATLMKSRFCPGSYIGTSGNDLNDIAVNYLTESSNGAVTAYPTVTAETLWWFNARKPWYNFYLSTDSEYGFGFTGFKPAQDNTKIVGQVLGGLNFTFMPRYHAQVYGITG